MFSGLSYNFNHFLKISPMLTAMNYFSLTLHILIMQKAFILYVFLTLTSKISYIGLNCIFFWPYLDILTNFIDFLIFFDPVDGNENVHYGESCCSPPLYPPLVFLLLPRAVFVKSLCLKSFRNRHDKTLTPISLGLNMSAW